MDFSSICRTCLSSSILKPIFSENSDVNYLSEYIFEATGVKIQYNDSLPQNMCTKCKIKMRNCYNFRKLCKETEECLLQVERDINSKKSTKKLTSSRKVKKSTANVNTENVATIIEDTICEDLDTDITDNYNYDTNNDQDTLWVTFDNDNDTKTDPSIESHNETSENEELNIAEDFNEQTFNYNDTDYDNNFDTQNDDMSNEEDTFSQQLDTINDKKSLKLLKYNKNDLNTDETKSLSQRKRYNDTANDNLSKEILSKANQSQDVIYIDVPYVIIKNSSDEKVARVMCKLCQAELSIRSIDAHIARRHPGADRRKMKCDRCDAYVMKDKWNRHQVMKHGKDGLACGFCLTSFKDKPTLIDHVSICKSKKKPKPAHNGGRELSQCDVCHKTMQRASINMHKKIKHAGLRPVCEHCGRGFGSKFRLNEHLRAKHGHEKFRCDRCEFESASVVAMRNHERRHLGEKPFICELCGAKFHAAYLLTQHRSSHTTLRPVNCEQCPATFKTNNSLHMHKLTCHSTSLYKCNICSRSYSCRYYAMKHLRHVHQYTGNAPPIEKLSKE